MRVSVFVDGFNFYHAVDDLGKHHLKWVNLRTLCEQFAPRGQYTLNHIYYFSAEIFGNLQCLQAIGWSV